MSTFDAIAVIGPTASGKSALAMQLAKERNGEIVSCDSVQVYKDFDIGSAKPTKAEQAEVPHHLIDVVTWREPMDAGRYARLAEAAIRDIRARGRLPIVVGGTGLYLRALVADRWHGDLPKDEQLRIQLEDQTNEQLIETLKKIDPERAAELHANDRVRLLRAVEIATLAGGDWREKQQKAEPILRPHIIRLDPDRTLLHKRIALRAQQMLDLGLIDEVRRILASGCPPDARPMLSIGYKQAADYLAGTLPEPDIAEAITIATRQYAKRQNTWFKKLAVQELRGQVT